MTRKTTLGTFANEAVILASSSSLDVVASESQNHLNILKKWFKIGKKYMKVSYVNSHLRKALHQNFI